MRAVGTQQACVSNFAGFVFAPVVSASVGDVVFTVNLDIPLKWSDSIKNHSVSSVVSTDTQVFSIGEEGKKRLKVKRVSRDAEWRWKLERYTIIL